ERATAALQQLHRPNYEEEGGDGDEGGGSTLISPLEGEIWRRVLGGVKKNRVYGFGDSLQASALGVNVVGTSPPSVQSHVSPTGQEIKRAGISIQGPITINIQLPDHLASSISTLPTVVVQPSSHTQIPPTQLPPPHGSRAFGSEDETRDDIGS
ncbi:hypothetical protein Dimus_035500, partial [Dionaea muscipula]